MLMFHCIKAYYYNLKFNSCQQVFIWVKSVAGVCEELPDCAWVRHRLYHHAGFNDDDDDDHDDDYDHYDDGGHHDDCDGDDHYLKYGTKLDDGDEDKISADDNVYPDPVWTCCGGHLHNGLQISNVCGTSFRSCSFEVVFLLMMMGHTIRLAFMFVLWYHDDDKYAGLKVGSQSKKQKYLHSWAIQALPQTRRRGGGTPFPDGFCKYTFDTIPTKS